MVFNSAILQSLIDDLEKNNYSLKVPEGEEEKKLFQEFYERFKQQAGVAMRVGSKKL